MRTLGVLCSVTIFAAVVASCSFPGDKGSPSCETDAQLCPKSSRAATSVTCDCQCTVGISEDTGDHYAGRVAACLPAALNGAIATGEVQSALSTLAERTFDQRVFQYCSQDVAAYVRAAIKAPIGLRACAIPLHCECTTKGAVHDSPACHAECPEVGCTKKNCPAVLWRHGKLDASVCSCSRATTCGTTEPAPEHRGFCRDWQTSTADAPLDDAGALQ